MMCYCLRPRVHSIYFRGHLCDIRVVLLVVWAYNGGDRLGTREQNGFTSPLNPAVEGVFFCDRDSGTRSREPEPRSWEPEPRELENPGTREPCLMPL
jgi:hypothetical protein